MSLKICSYSKDVLSIICEEDIFLNTRKEGNIHKYKFYKNMYQNLDNKKIANLLFNVTYKKNDNYNNHFNTNTYYNQDSVLSEYNTLNNITNLSKIEKFSTYEEESVLPFLYYGIKNQTILLNGSRNNLNDILKNQRSNFFSIHDIEELEISGELKSERISFERLLELLSISKKKFEFYEILRKLNYYIMKKELDIENIVLIMQKIIYRLDELKYNQELHDEVLTPFIYFVLKNILTKMKIILENDFNIFLNLNIMNKNTNKIRKNTEDNENICIQNFNKMDINFPNENLINNGNIFSNYETKLSNKININDENIRFNIYKHENINNEINPKEISMSENFDFSSPNLVNLINNSRKNEKLKSNIFNGNDKIKNNHEDKIKNIVFDLKCLNNIIIKSFYISIKTIEFHSFSYYSNKNLNIIYENLLPNRAFFNFESFFNNNRKKISSTLSYLSKLLQEYVSLTYNKNNNIKLNVVFKDKDLTRNCNNQNNYLLKEKEKLFSEEIDQIRFSNFIYNLYLIINHACKYYDNSELILNILNIQIKIIKIKNLENLRDVMFDRILTDDIYLNINRNFKNDKNILTNLFYLSSVYSSFMNNNFPEITKVIIFKCFNFLYLKI